MLSSCPSMVGPALAAPAASGLDAFVLVGAIVAVMWVVEAINSVDGYALDSDGIRPRQLSGLAGNRVLAVPARELELYLLGNT